MTAPLETGAGESVTSPSRPRRLAGLRRITRSFIPKHNAPLLYGGYASLAYGLWAFFEKLAAETNALVVNAIVYITAFSIACLGLRRWRPPSLTALVAGIAGGAVNIIIIYSLTHHKLVLVFPFVSAGSIVFAALSYFFLDGQFLLSNRKHFGVGSILALVGLTFCSLGLSGGVRSVSWDQVDAGSIALGLLLSLLTGTWIFLAFLTLVEHRYEPLIATTWVFLGSLLLAFGAVLPRISTLDIKLTASTASALCAGVFMFLGEYWTYKAFSLASAPDKKADQAFVALLANSELVPIVLLSALFLKERTAEGFLGAALVLAGIAFINNSRATS